MGLKRGRGRRIPLDDLSSGRCVTSKWFATPRRLNFEHQRLPGLWRYYLQESAREYYTCVVYTPPLTDPLYRGLATLTVYSSVARVSTEKTRPT